MQSQSIDFDFDNEKQFSLNSDFFDDLFSTSTQQQAKEKLFTAFDAADDDHSSLRSVSQFAVASSQTEEKRVANCVHQECRNDFGSECMFDFKDEEMSLSYFNNNNQIHAVQNVQNNQLQNNQVQASINNAEDEEKSEVFMSSNDNLEEEEESDFSASTMAEKAAPITLVSKKIKKEKKTRQSRKGSMIKRNQFTVQKVFDLVKQWRAIGKTQDVNNFKTAANNIGMSRKTMDDYLSQIKMGILAKYDFEAHGDEKIGHLRAFNKKSGVSLREAQQANKKMAKKQTFGF